MPFSSRLRAIALFFAGQTAQLLFHYPKIISAWIRHASGKREFVTEQIPGELSFDNNKFAIYLIWQPKAIPWYVQNALDALAEAKINVILVVNHPLDAEMRQTLSKQSRHILIRDNTGFDIGGYQDATGFVRENFSIRRLLYINDSVYLFREGLSEMFKRMTESSSDICTVFENWEFQYHIQSFCFSVSQQIFNSKEFVQFWEEYIPANTRLWAINKGEIGLSRAIVPIANSFEIIYSPNSIRDKLKEIGLDDLMSLDIFVPIRIRSAYGDKFPPRSILEQNLINHLSVYSQIHTGGFLFRKFLRSPVIKRDLVYRMQYSIYDVENFLETVGHEGHIQEILSDMRRKGSGNQLPLLKKIQFMQGII